MSHFIVIGAGQAGQSIVTTLRGQGFDGKITLIGDEPVPPYQRPPLSKAYLLGDMELERLYLRPESFYADQNISLRLGAHVSAIDPAAKTLTVDGETLAYDQLALTTGSTPRRLPAAIGGALDGVYVVRGLSDVQNQTPTTNRIIPRPINPISKIFIHPPVQRKIAMKYLLRTPY